MDALGLKADWHQTAEVSVYCPFCGDEIRQGIAFHQSSAGVLCVLDPERALKAGAIDRDKYESLMELRQGDEMAAELDEEEEQPRRGRGAKRV